MSNNIKRIEEEGDPQHRAIQRMQAILNSIAMEHNLTLDRIEELEAENKELRSKLEETE